jgi:triphosphoribosyl-dephospho-CoA synthase
MTSSSPSSFSARDKAPFESSLITKPHAVGQLAELACRWEVLARKAGNVCPGLEYPDLTVQDFLASAAAIAPNMDRAVDQPLGVTILGAVEATRRVANTNTNLGIVLLLAPLARVPRELPLNVATLTEIIETSTVADARRVYEAIRLARPAGLGSAPDQDIAAEPILPLHQVMALARHRDRIAEQYATGFALVLEDITPELIRRVQRHGNLERALVETQLWLMSRYLDSHIERKRGTQEAGAVMESARRLASLDLSSPEGRHAFVAFDAWLRADNHARNPGTTADLLAASLFTALRQHAIPADVPFAWPDHPFEN